MQVKIFKGVDYGVLEKEVNTWLKEHTDLEFLFVTHSQSTIENGIYASISVWYESTPI